MTIKHLALASMFLFAAACGGGKPKPDPQPKPDPASGGIPCSAELALACDTESADGCLDNRTQFHVCVPNGETGGPPCEQEIAKVCGEGQIDACLATPVYATSHLCVFAPGEPAKAGSACPEGQGYYVPGCGSGGKELPTEGCYAGCDGGAACGAGFTCETVDIDPCHGQMCDACGGNKQLCIPSV